MLSDTSWAHFEGLYFAKSKGSTFRSTLKILKNSKQFRKKELFSSFGLRKIASIQLTQKELRCALSLARTIAQNMRTMFSSWALWTKMTTFSDRPKEGSNPSQTFHSSYSYQTLLNSWVLYLSRTQAILEARALAEIAGTSERHSYLIPLSE